MTKAVLLKMIIKIMFILALVAFLTWKTVICVQHYIENPTYTTNRYVKQNETDFPAITICPAMPYGYKNKSLFTFSDRFISSLISPIEKCKILHNVILGPFWTKIK